MNGDALTPLHDGLMEPIADEHHTGQPVRADAIFHDRECNARARADAWAERARADAGGDPEGLWADAAPLSTLNAPDIDAGPEQLARDGHRLQTRRLLREFVSAVPRSEPETTLTLLRADGGQRVLTRREVSAAIDRMRPRQRQVVRLALEELWPQGRVCAYLHGISPRTVQRDLAEALDLLAQL